MQKGPTWSIKILPFLMSSVMRVSRRRLLSRETEQVPPSSPYDPKPFCLMCRGKQVAIDVAAGLHWLHTRRIVHFDLKVLRSTVPLMECHISGLSLRAHGGFVSACGNPGRADLSVQL